MKKIYRIFRDVKSISERQRKRELFSIISERRRKEKEIEEIEKLKSEIAGKFNTTGEEGVPAFLMAQFLNYIEGLRDERRKKEEELKKISEMEESARQRYIEARRELQMAERILERAKMKELKEMIRREENFSDELVLIKKAREKEE